MTTEWQSRPEVASAGLVTAFARVCLFCGPRLARLMLGPVCAWFWLARGEERALSRDYLRRVLGREPRWRDTWRHFWNFSSVTLDRLFILGADGRGIDVELSGTAALDEPLDAGQGCFLLGSHLGSFEASRVARHRRPQLPLRYVQDRRQNPAITALFESLNPSLAGEVLDLGGSPNVGLKLSETLRDGALVALLGDRVRGREASVPVQFLGGTAHLPTAPWQLAMVLGVPVVLFFGLRVGAGQYRVVFERFEVPSGVARAERAAALAECAQRYADRLAARATEAPYNWFNFFDYWAER
ncbi:hypothetical protein F3N42_08785 [Marinihelvus fidelis]|uniref:Lipid A biosynthesis acyltransferase n=1 Tax=Marinihelvus fidelis TaxID=2613842 RepID=A0A5N0TC48_9GAMM|nr:hypothetical protein [Marinihelvus fidelis]KAA9131406.1 hypothetical protein F3N42_08785 [Marinihelvus fidelis]